MRAEKTPLRSNRPVHASPAVKRKFIGLQSDAVWACIGESQFRSFGTPSFLTPVSFPDYLMASAGAGGAPASFVFHLGFDLLAVGAAGMRHNRIAGLTFRDILGLDINNKAFFVAGTISHGFENTVLLTEIILDLRVFRPSIDLSPVSEFFIDQLLIVNGFSVLHKVIQTAPPRTVISAACK